MKSTVLFSTLILLFVNCSAQDTLSGKPTIVKPHTLHVFKMDGSVLKGFLYEASASGISISHSTKEPTAFNSLTPDQIDKLYLRRKGSIGIGATLGAIGGGIIGAIIGASIQPYDIETNPGGNYKEVNTTAGAIVGVFSGAGLGMIIGTLTKKKFIIHGKKENYQLKYPGIVERAMVHN